MKVYNKILVVKEVIKSKKTKGYDKVEKLCPLLGRNMTFQINSNLEQLLYARRQKGNRENAVEINRKQINETM